MKFNSQFSAPVSDSHTCTSIEQNHAEYCEYLHELYLKKNKEYGDSFFEMYKKLGMISCMTQIAHKFNRAIHLVQTNETPTYESLSDTLLDLANYCIITASILKDEQKKDNPVPMEK